MTEVEAALEIVKNHRIRTRSERVALREATGRILSEDVISPSTHPFFDQTAVDGYAFKLEDLSQFETLEVVAEIPAGHTEEVNLKKGECARIFTGAPVPESADTVVMQEFTVVSDRKVKVNDPGLKFGGNVRKAGEQIRTGEVALKKGTFLNPAGIGFLASIGITEVTVFKPVSIGVVVTGNEFAEGQDDLVHGKIFESNGKMLESACKLYGFTCEYVQANDSLEEISAAIREMKDKHDLVLVTGGVSVGDYDFTRPALESAGYTVQFHKVNQKPGKPLLFAAAGEKAAFGLPGNPRAVMICFYMYVLPLIAERLSRAPYLAPLTLPLAHDHYKKDGKTHFVAGMTEGGKVRISREQNSHMLYSLSAGDVIIRLPAAQAEYAAGDPVECFILQAH